MDMKNAAEAETQLRSLYQDSMQIPPAPVVFHLSLDLRDKLGVVQSGATSESSPGCGRGSGQRMLTSRLLQLCASIDNSLLFGIKRGGGDTRDGDDCR